MTQSIGITVFRCSFLLGVLVLLLQARNAYAANTVIWKNHCDYDLYFWAVSHKGQERDDAFTLVPAHSEHVHQMMEGGIALKYRDFPYYTEAPAGILQAEYYMDRTVGKLWYDSSIIDCGRDLGPQNPYYCPFAYGGLNMYIVGDRGDRYNCKDSFCQLGGQCDNSTYLRPGGYKDEPSLSCPLGVDLVFETCTETSVEKTWVGTQVGPAPAPAPWQPPPAPWASKDTSVATTLLSSVTKATAPFVAVTTRPTRPPRPQTYSAPQGYPNETVCFDPDCKCYAFPGESQSGRPDCTGFEGALECLYFDDCATWRRTEKKRQGRQ